MSSHSKLQAFWHSKSMILFRIETAKVILNFWIAGISLISTWLLIRTIKYLYGTEAEIFEYLSFDYFIQAAFLVILLRFLWSVIRRG